MSKQAPPTPNNAVKNGRKGPMSGKISPAVAQALLEDAVLEAAAEIAALSASVEPGGMPGAITLETPEEVQAMALIHSELLGIPFLGESRIQALAEIGIKTRADLQAAPPEQIGGVKGIGVTNAKKIQEWLANQPVAALPAPRDLPPTSPDLQTAITNQTRQDDLGEIEEAVQRIHQLLPDTKAHKRLDRQVEKLSTVLSELAEGPDTLRAKQVKRSLKALHRIALLLGGAAAEQRLSEKKMERLADELRDSRKRLHKIIDGDE